MIKILTHYTENWQSLAEITLPVLTEYCEKYGYELCVRKVPEYSVYSGVDKLEMINRNLFYGDIGLVLDCDTLLTNFNTKVEDFLEDGKDWYMSEGLNAGVFIIRQTPVNEKIIDLIVEEIRCEIYHCEQDAFENHSKHIPNFCVKKHPCFNSYLPELYGHIEKPEEVTEEQGRWVEGKSFILHLPSLGMNQRLEIMKSIKITK